MSISTSGDRFAAFRHRSYALFFSSRFLAAFAIQIVSVSVGWQMYEVTRNTLYLGLIGLVQFLPALLLILVTGSVADRYNRRVIVSACMTLAAISAAALLGLTLVGAFEPMPVFIILVLFGIERAFMGPAVQSLAPNLVPEKDLANAIAWNSSSWQTASIIGPVAGGLLYGLGASVAYSVALAMFVLGAVLVPSFRNRRNVHPPRLPAGQKFSLVSASSVVKKWCWAPSRSICLPFFLVGRSR